MNTKNNRRARETRQRIHAALLQLLETQELDQITISALCQQAEVNRSTFYAHYDGVVDLMEEIEQDIGQELAEALHGTTIDEGQVLSRAHLVLVLEGIARHQPFYRAYLHTAYGQNRVTWGFEYVLESVLRPFMHRLGIPDNEVAYYFAFTKTGILALVRLWVEQGCPESPEELARITWNVLGHPAVPW